MAAQNCNYLHYLQALPFKLWSKCQGGAKTNNSKRVFNSKIEVECPDVAGTYIEVMWSTHTIILSFVRPLSIMSERSITQEFNARAKERKNYF